jgi:hypothetical protein
MDFTVANTESSNLTVSVAGAVYSVATFAGASASRRHAFLNDS